MNTAACIWCVLTSATIGAYGKIGLDSLDQLETNLIGDVEPSPTRRVLEQQDWVKISEAPPTVVNTRLGERVEIECEVFGSPNPEIQWLRGDMSVSMMHKTKLSAGLTKVKSRLVIDCVTRKHEGFYTCSATAGSKSIKTNPTLLLVDGYRSGDLEMCSPGHRSPPRVVSWTPTAMDIMGASVVLPCVVTGNPKPQVYWIDPQNNVLNSIRHTVAANGDLTISQLAWPDMGEYTCVAESPEGKDQVSTFVYPVLSSK